MNVLLALKNQTFTSEKFGICIFENTAGDPRPGCCQVFETILVSIGNMLMKHSFLREKHFQAACCFEVARKAPMPTDERMDVALFYFTRVTDL